MRIIAIIGVIGLAAGCGGVDPTLFSEADDGAAGLGGAGGSPLEGGSGGSPLEGGEGGESAVGALFALSYASAPTAPPECAETADCPLDPYGDVECIDAQCVTECTPPWELGDADVCGCPLDCCLDSECPADWSCLGGECVDPCDPAYCGALCPPSCTPTCSLDHQCQCLCP